jgi:hypothetical protein
MLSELAGARENSRALASYARTEVMVDALGRVRFLTEDTRYPSSISARPFSKLRIEPRSDQNRTHDQ